MNPAQSARVAFGSRDSLTRNSVIAKAIRPSGTLTKKIQRQERSVVMIPPSTGPTATETPVVAPKTAKAAPRSRATEGVGDERERDREHRRPADPLQTARDAEEGRRSAHSAQD